MIKGGRGEQTAASAHIFDAISTKTNWKDILIGFLKKAVTKPIKIRQETWAKPHSSYYTGKVPYLPGYKRKTIEQPFERVIGIAIDTSGSVWKGKTADGERFIDRFFSEIKTVMKSGDFKALLMLWSTDVEQEEVVTKQNVAVVLNNLYPGGGSTAVSKVYKRLTSPGRSKKQGDQILLTDPKDPKQPLGILCGMIYITDLEFDPDDPGLFLPVPTVIFGPKLLNSKKQKTQHNKLKQKGFTIVYFNTGRE
jgi:hypothetical protein